MTALFIDTSAFIALIDKDDQYHAQAREFYQKKLSPPFKLTTTNFVVCETINFLRARLPLKYAVEYRDDIITSKIVSIIHITPDMEISAFNVMKRHKDKNYSFTDCTSFVVMKELSITTSFTFDEHFRQMGFAVFP